MMGKNKRKLSYSIITNLLQVTQPQFVRTIHEVQVLHIMNDLKEYREDEKIIMNSTANRIRQHLETVRNTVLPQYLLFQCWFFNLTILQNCFREGAVSGKQEHFQRNFDKGYTDGFDKAYELGLSSARNR